MMKKKSNQITRRILTLTSILFLANGIAHSQVGINTQNPNATIDIVATKTDGTTAEGVIAPRLTLTQLVGKDAKYTASQTGTIVYVPDVTGTTTTKTAKITSIGYYYFDGALWQPFSSSSAATDSNPWYKVGTSASSTLNTDDSYLNGVAVVGGSTIASVNGTNARLTVTGGDASINGITVGKGKGNGATNTAIGTNALGANTSGLGNTAVGANAGNTLTSGSNNILIGAQVQTPVTTGNNQINIGNAIHGTSSGTPGGGAVSIGKTAPAAGIKLDVNGKMRYTDGTEQNGAILTSDALGNASWVIMNSLKTPQVVSPYGTAYSGTIANAPTQAIGPTVTIPANSTWMIFTAQLIRLERALTGTEFLFTRLYWSGSGIQILGGSLMSAPLNVGMFYNVVSGLSVVRNPTGAPVVCTLKVSNFDGPSAQLDTNIKYFQLFGGWSESSLFMIPVN